MSNEFIAVSPAFKAAFDEAWDAQRTELSRLLFPYGRTAYMENLDALIEHVGTDGGIDRTAKPWWKNRLD